MPVSNSDLKAYKSHTASSDPSGASALTGSDISTGGKGGNANLSALISGSLHEIFRAVSGNDTDGSDFVDYYKLYLRNTNVASDLTTPKVYLSSLSSYADDEISISLGLTQENVFISGAGTRDLGRADYEEDVDAGSRPDSAYPRIIGTGAMIDQVADYSLDNDPAIWTTSGIVKLATGTGGNAVQTDKYVRVIGENAGVATVGYILVPAGNTGTKYTAKNLRPDWNGGSPIEAGGASDVTFTRVLGAYVHDFEYGGVTIATSGDEEGDISSIEMATADRDGQFYVNVGGGDVAIGKIYCILTGGDPGQIYVPAFFKQSWINSSSTGLCLPVLTPAASGTNEFGERKNDYHAIWIRRKVVSGAAAGAGIENQIALTGSSS